MRIKDITVFERKKQTTEFQRKYFIAFEGFSEYLYFEGVKRHREQISICNTVDIQLLDRFHHDQSDSDPRSIITKMQEYRKLIKEGTYSSRLFIGDILQQVYELKCFNQKNEERKTCVKEISKIYPLLKSNLDNSEYVINGEIKDRCWDEAAEQCKAFISEHYKENIPIQTPPDRKMETFDEDTDIFCLVVDRDVQCRPSRYYRYLQQDCEKYHISLYVTNPCFEFWLLLHFEKTINLPQTTIEALGSLTL